MMSEMDRFPEDQVQSYYIIGESRTNADNAITKMYGSFYMAFEVDEETEQVLDFGCTHTLQLTEEYLKRLFIGRNFPKIDSWLEKKLEQCYGGLLPKGGPRGIPERPEAVSNDAEGREKRAGLTI